MKYINPLVRPYSTRLVMIVVFAIAAATFAADDVTIHLDKPDGWTGETITLPPGFARDMALKGIEEIRFAPGMFKADSKGFFSYALVFYLPDTKPLSQKMIDAELLKYYRGLASAVGRSRKRNIDPSKFTLKSAPVAGEIGRYTVVLDWVEPFTTGKPQRLFIEVQAARCPNKQASYVSMAVSPRRTTEPIWNSLRNILQSVKFQSVEEKSP